MKVHGDAVFVSADVVQFLNGDYDAFNDCPWTY